MESRSQTLKQIVPLRLLEGVYQLTPGWEKRYFLRTPDGNILIDTPPGQESVFSAIEMLGGASILFITHRDTVGDAWLFRERLGVRVAMHPDDADFLTGAPPEIELSDGLYLTPETRVLHAPGHSPGSCALLLERAPGALFPGDVVIADAEGRLQLPLEGYSKNPRRARDAVSLLLKYPFDALLPAHGTPILQDATARVREFVSRH
ncbi:MAG TPA: MBL fold metallo-hydrolase [Armatimonadetes bacterium]|jgi:glyoxylase-like metal-dependent hydrolase (beta-lactamase superfamily II)|nr:MBL fold metallo-hydrolase [Armatimonadota bacterium]